ncbi:hypothetical protein Tco_1366984, partial [Tanacetum coccineum]
EFCGGEEDEKELVEMREVGEGPFGEGEGGERGRKGTAAAGVDRDRDAEKEETGRIYADGFLKLLEFLYERSNVRTPGLPGVRIFPLVTRGPLWYEVAVMSVRGTVPVAADQSECDTWHSARVSTR